MAKPAEAAIENAFDGGESEPGGEGGGKHGKSPKRALGIMFRDAQWGALGQQAIDAKQRGLATTEQMINRMEAEKPGSGFREGLKIDAALKKNYQAAESTQYIETFQRWCTVLASNTLNTEDSDKNHKGTNLGKSVDVNKVVRMPDEVGYPKEVIPGLDKTPGVLNLTLERNSQVTVDAMNRQSHPLKVKSATISGLESEDFRSTIKDIPLSELKMPIVAKYSELKDSGGVIGDNRGFVIGKNEVPEYWGSEQGDYLSGEVASRMGKASVDVKSAAKHILDQEIGKTTVDPKKP
jgi:hypothetical protein